MTSPDLLLQAIYADLDDDTVRLIFADWLEEHGHPDEQKRAHLIRTQIELSRWIPDLQTRTALQKTEQELREQHGIIWLGTLRRFCLGWRYVRGLVNLTIQARRFTGRPFAREVGIEGMHRALVGTVRLERVADQMRKLSESHVLDGVASLDLSQNKLNDTHIQTLLESGYLRGLRQLNLSNNRLKDSSLLALIDSPVWSQLNWLDLRNNQISSAAVRRLLNAPTDHFRCLKLHGNPLDEASRTQLIEFQSSLRGSATALPGLTNSIGMEFVCIPAGTFLMGSPDDEVRRRDDEGPIHAVEITRPLYLGVYQVTQEQYERVMENNPSQFDANNRGGPTHPVDYVSWGDALAFCIKLSDLPQERAAGRSYRLPTEAEWEHACRAGTTTPFWFGGPQPATVINYDGTYNYGGAPKGPYLRHTTPVGSYPPNSFGLYDMHGNVWEWCQDRYSATYYEESPRRDPKGPEEGDRHVLRGGCWDCVGWYVRSAIRHGDPADHVDHFNGFRVVLELSEEEEARSQRSTAIQSASSPHVRGS